MSKRFYWKKIRPILLTVVLCSIFFLILMAITSNRNGNLTIYVDRTSVNKSLSLSESSKLTNAVGKLVGPSMVDANDAKGTLIPEDLYLKDGNNSATTKDGSYLAYTFYVFNSGSQTLDYEMKFNLENQSKNLDEALRIKLYINDEIPVTYSKRVSGVSEFDDSLTSDFESSKIIASNTVTNLEPGQSTRYTILIWIEQDDMHCNNDKLGGSVTLSMSFSVLGEL